MIYLSYKKKTTDDKQLEFFSVRKDNLRYKIVFYERVMSMSFLICRMEKFQKCDVKGIQFHDQRERDSKTNPDIDKEQSHLNYDLHNTAKIDFNKTVNKRIDELNVTKKPRKDAVVMNEFVITSDKGFFDKLPEFKQKEFFQESYEFMSERYGKENVIHSTVHIDETTPHMHFAIVPVTEDGRLCSKDIFNRQELRDIQTDFAKHLQDKGFDIKRGQENSSAQHIEIQRLKMNTLKNQINDIEQVQSSQGDINSIETKKSILGAFTKEITVSEESFNEVKELAKECLANRNELRDTKKELEYQKENNQKLRKNYDVEHTENAQKGWQIYDLQKENKKLKEYKDIVQQEHPEVHREVERNLVIQNKKDRGLSRER